MTICYPATTDWGCYGDEAEVAAIPAPVKARAEALAWYTLAALCAYRIGVCPTTIRPCAARCASHGSWAAAPLTGAHVSALPLQTIGGIYTPYVTAGQWVNSCGCVGADDCSCTSLSEVILPGPVGGIESVVIDGVPLDPNAYRVDNGNRLVRLDGDTWPVCQDMTEPSAPTYEPVTMSGPQGSVTFTRKGDIVYLSVTLTGATTADPFLGAPPWPPTAYVTFDMSGTGYLEVAAAAVSLYGGAAAQYEFAYVTPAPAGPVDQVEIPFTPDGLYNTAWTGTLLFRRDGDTVTLTIDATGTSDVPAFTQGIFLNAVPVGFRIPDAEGAANALSWNESTYAVQVNGETSAQPRVVAFYSTTVTPAGEPFTVTIEWETADPFPGPPSGSTFEVTYYRGAAPNELTNYAAGVLAAEFAKACMNKKCRLPRGVTSVVRAGTTMEFRSDIWEGGLTTIPEVDTVINIYNPNHLKQAPRVLSPESRRRGGRTTTWGVR